MRTVGLLLVGATLGCVLWCGFLYEVLPMAVVEQLYDHVRPELVGLMGDEKTQQIMRPLTLVMSSGVHSAVVATAIPLLLTNVAWGCLTFSLLRRTKDNEQSK